MPVESASFISQLNPSYPDGSENVAEGDNHLRMLKSMLQSQFTSLGTTAVSATAAQLNAAARKDGDTYTGAQNFTGATVTVPTATAGDATASAASTAFVQTAIAGVNSQTALTLTVASGTTASPTVGEHVVCTNAAAVTVTLPASASAGDRVKATFTNGLFSNVISPNGNNLFGVAGNRTVNAAQAAVEFVFSDASTGWVY
ncbi:MAG TPA: hypothetical protein PKC59_02795 [Burkholderiaceae bacterium]|jgi:hypothetical protein|nr:hypothetical protein [Burkholderiaceae bacterium]